MKLMTTMFQNLFPSINIQKVHLSEIRRCVLLSYNADTKTIDFRHYNIQAAPVGVSRGVKKLIQTKVPNMSQLSDISDYVLRGGCGYGSESEGEDPVDSRVLLPQDVPGRGNVKAQQSAIRLTELGPRLCLQLVKIEEGLCSGEVLFHEFVKKTAKEIKKMKKEREEKRKLKEQRKKQQEENIKRKEKEKALNKTRSIEGQLKKQKLEEDANHVEDDDAPIEETADAVDSDDADWYRQEVGAEPEAELFPKGSTRRKRKEPSQPGKKRKRKEPSQPGKKRKRKEPSQPGKKRKRTETNDDKPRKKPAKSKEMGHHKLEKDRTLKKSNKVKKGPKSKAKLKSKVKNKVRKS